MDKLYYCYNMFDNPNENVETFQNELQLLAQLQAAINYNERIQRDDEWAAVTGMMLMHYEAVPKTENNNNKQIEMPKPYGSFGLGTSGLMGRHNDAVRKTEANDNKQIAKLNTGSQHRSDLPIMENGNYNAMETPEPGGSTRIGKPGLMTMHHETVRKMKHNNKKIEAAHLDNIFQMGISGLMLMDNGVVHNMEYNNVLAKATGSTSGLAIEGDNNQQHTTVNNTSAPNNSNPIEIVKPDGTTVNGTSERMLMGDGAAAENNDGSEKLQNGTSRIDTAGLMLVRDDKAVTKNRR